MERAHDPARHGLFEPKGRADRDDRVARGELGRVADREGMELRRRRVDPDHGQVGRGITDERGRIAGAVGERDLDRGRAVDDVVVRDDVAGGVVFQPEPCAPPPFSSMVISTTPLWAAW